MSGGRPPNQHEASRQRLQELETIARTGLDEAKRRLNLLEARKMQSSTNTFAKGASTQNDSELLR